MGKQADRSKNGKSTRSTGLGNSGSASDYRKTNYINVYFNEEDKQRIQALLAERDFIVCEFLSELALDFSINLKHDPMSGKWLGLLFPFGNEHPFATHALSVRHSDRLMALFGLAYAHIHKFAGKWPIGELADEDDWA